MLRVTRPYLNLPMKPRFFIMFSGKKYNFMHLKGKMKCLSKCIFFFFFSRKKLIKNKLCFLTLPKIFKPVTRNIFFLFGLIYALTLKGHIIVVADSNFFFILVETVLFHCDKWISKYSNTPHVYSKR